MGSVVSKSVSSESFGSTSSFLEYDRVIFHLKQGDLIEVYRKRYRHWVICESIDSNGTVWCFHVTAVWSDQTDDDHNIQPILRKEIPFNGKALLKYEPLEDILKDTEDGIPSLCRVNNQQNMARKLLTAIGNQLPQLSEVFAVLHRLKNTILKYDLKASNCEHYCTFWKYGIGWSSQVNSFKEILTAGLQIISTTTKAMANIADRSGWHQIGLVCLLVSTVASMAAEVVKGIEFTLNDLKIEDFVRQAITY